MSTNNISEKQIFSYVVSTFSYWGIKSVTQQTLKQAKKNLPSGIKQMKRTLFGLVLLHMFDYKIRISEYVSGADVKEQEMDEVIMAYLAECQCPLLLEMKNAKSQQAQQQQVNAVQYYVGCNLQSSRNLLIICGWVMSISDYFSQILPNAIQSRLHKIQSPQQCLKSVQYVMQTKLNQMKLTTTNNQQQIQLISPLYKSIKAHLYQTQCYKQKRSKLKYRLEQMLQKLFNTSVPLETLLNGSSGDKQGRKQAQLQQIIQNQIENMNQRKYFWIWLQEKIIKQTQTQIKQNNEFYDTYQANQNDIIYDCQVDLQYLNKYIELCHYYNQKYHELTQRMNQLRPTNRRFKEIQAQTKYEFDQTLSRKNNTINKKHLFIALQLKTHLNINLNQPKNSKQNQENRPNNNSNSAQMTKNSGSMSKKHKKQIRKYLHSIQDSIKFI